MKNKKSIYILLPLVVLIWGYVAVKIITYGEDEPAADPIIIGDIVAGKDQRQTARTLQLNYADPFLKRTRGYRTTSSTGVQSQKARRPKEEPNINWGSITYNGYILNQRKKTKIALLTINGRQELAKLGESFGGRKVRAIRQDSVQLQVGSASKWFVKSKE